VNDVVHGLLNEALRGPYKSGALGCSLVSLVVNLALIQITKVKNLQHSLLCEFL